MRWPVKILLRARSLFRRSAVDGDLDEELRFHVERQTAVNIAAGMPPAEARREALREFGGVEGLKEECRDMRKINWSQDLAQDLRYGLRMLGKSPGFAAVAILTLALGIGANTAIFSIVDSLLLRPLPVEDPAHLTVLAFRQGSGQLLTQFSIADYRDIREQTSGAFSSMIGFQLSLDGLSMTGRAERVLTNYVTGNYFSNLGLKPYLGRLILPSEGQTPGADPVVVLSYSYWKNYLGADPSIIGRKVLVNGHPSTVIGIAPRGFHGLYPAPGVEAFLPLAMLSSYEQGWPADFMVNRILQNLYILARLRPGVTLANAGAALNIVARRLSTQYPDSDRGLQLSVYSELFARPDPGTAPTLFKASALFLALVALVLLLACANIANLLLVRSTARGREMAVRAALGAPRSRLIRQLLTESILLALLGGLGGIFLGLWAADAVASVNLHTPVNVPLYSGLDWRVFVYAFAAALFTGVLVGLVPALRVSRTHISAALHESGRTVASGKNRVRTSLVIIQVAGSLTLLVIAGLFTRSLANVQHANLGFDPHNVVNLVMDPSEVGYNETQGLSFYNSLLERIRALPGVQSASLTSSLPMSNFGSNDYLKVSNYQNPAGQGLPLVSYGLISTGYFRTMRIPIVQGRSFSNTDTKGSPYVAVVNQTFARRFWPHQNPIGQRFAKVSGANNPVYQVVGIVRDSRFSGLTGPVDAYFYLPLAQDYALSSLQILQIRDAAPPDAVMRQAQSIIQSLAPSLPVFDVETMSESLDTLSGFLLFRLGAGLAAALGLLGLILAAVGVYGVISYSTNQRTHEIGIRVALGAQPGQILKLILRQGVLVVGTGLVAGCAAALIAARLIGNLLVGVSPADPLTYISVVVILALIASAASYIPARRAMRVDPMVALRYE
ncbi:MAG TPA: ABC transporter permease [Candidatus Acidoferrales bacterium]|nr:ABC transporter permease [Candidatus Acidoferrales bacterium]